MGYFRLETYGATHDRIGINARALGSGLMLDPSEFEARFQSVGHLDDNLKVSLMQAPEIDPVKYGYDFKLEKKRTNPIKIPDIITFRTHQNIVSEKVREVIEAFDDFPHQFQKCRMFNHEDVELTERQFYLINIRRYVQFEAGKPPEIKPPYQMTYTEKQVLGTIETNPELKEKLSKLPIWHIRGDRNTLYLSEGLVSELRAKNVIGMDEFSVPLGRDEECLVQVWEADKHRTIYE
ncbi:imm11 family protein [Aestuariispira insulae]|uniref:Immunity MXAN-0049 protein domain-containing protein n=1 Tax=Aestuariispira insulae TaxID=1461337 RepID=A0A3D9H589_9PROT|nr:DUF1629 domain-containing protein [Aestuariispira insulae]RED44640.1 hypothetical protein DFP90_1142 [Aestuariispira insulae]